MIHVTIWDEDIQNETPEMQNVYPQGIRQVLADALSPDAELEIQTVHAKMPEFGLPDEVLAKTDVLIWWAHRTHKTLPDELAEKIQNEVLRGMGFIALHSAHLSKPFRRLMGTSCTLKYRYVDKERVFNTCPSHPIAQGLPEVFDIDIEEMYGEYFDVPKPDDVVFTSWFAGGHLFRGGCTWTRGRGRIFFFHVGHDTYPTFYHPYVQQIIHNAVHWCAPYAQKADSSCVETPVWEG